MAEKVKSSRNKTIDLSVEEGQEYLSRCIRVKEKTTLENIIDKTIIGDTFEVLNYLPESSVDLLIVDPPYNLDKSFHGNTFHKTNTDEYKEYSQRWIRAVKPLLKSSASIYVCTDWYTSMVMGPLLEEYFHVHNRITWQREKGRSASGNWKNAMEDIWFASVSEKYQFNSEAVKVRRRVIAPYRNDGSPKDWEETKDGNFRNTGASNFWDDISIPYWSMKENTAHPTQKPEKLLAKLILASSSPGDVILDPFVGSGSTSVTAKKLGRHYIGIEQNERYGVWTEKRLEMAEGDPSIQGYTHGVFWERNTAGLQKKENRKSGKIYAV